MANLVDGFEDSFGMELLSTVHWVVRFEGADTLEKTVRHVWTWNRRKRKFTERQIEIARERLASQGWIAVDA